jgi:hypothetical protein
VSLYARPGDRGATVDAIWLDNGDQARKSIRYARLGG